MLTGEPDPIARAREILDESTFESKENRLVFRAILQLSDQACAVDPITVTARLGRNADLDAADGKDRLTYLTDAVPTTANVVYHAQLVRGAAGRRQARDLLQLALAELATPGGDAGAAFQALRELSLEVTVGDEADSFPIVRVLEGTAPEPPALLVSDLLIDRDVNLWAGHGGAAKSVLALATTVCVALGRAVFGSLAVRRSGPVLLVVPEDGQAVVRMMLDAIIEGLGLDADERALCAERLVMVSDDSLVNLLRDTRRLRQTALKCHAVLVVLDPLRNLLGGEKEDSNDVAGACVDSLRRDVCRGAGAAVLVNHHNRKPGKDPGADTTASPHEARGAGAWANGARLVFSVTKKDGRITMTAAKANRIRSDICHELNLTIDADPENEAQWRTCTITDNNAGANSEALTPGIGRPLNQNERAALVCLDDRHEPDMRLAWSRWRDASGLNENTFRSIKKRLLGAGLAIAMPTGRKNRNGGADYSYQITPEGRSALKSGWAFEDLSGEGV
jgi:hypothetical protein